MVPPLGAPIPLLVGALLILARLAGVIWLTPFLGGRLVPSPVKVGLAGALTLLIAPALEAKVPFASPLILAGQVAQEALVGMAMGLAASLVFQGARMAGQVIDTLAGSSLAQALVPQLDDRAGVVGDLTFQLSVVLFLTLGGHVVYLQALAASFKVVPLGTGLPLALLADRMIALTQDMFLLAVALAAPVIGATLLADLALGLMARLAPGLNSFFLGMPLKAMLALLTLIATLQLAVGSSLVPRLGALARGVLGG